MAKKRSAAKARLNPKDVGINHVLEVAVDLCYQLDALKISHCVIGGVAYQRWGEPRQTVDVDATLLAALGTEEEVVAKILSLYESRVANPQQFALQNRILLVKSQLGTGIDLSLGCLPFEERVLSRSSHWEVPSHGSIRTCCAEDLVTLKAFANRPQDWIDIRNVLVRQGNRLDRNLIVQELAPLVELKEEPEILHQLEKLFAKN